MTRTLFLHVGTHKTGTKTLQHLFQDNAARLGAQGIDIWPQRNAFAFADLFLRPEVMSNMRLAGDCKVPDVAQFRTRVAEIHAGFAALAAPAVWLSSESFCLLRSAVEFAALSGVLYRHFDHVRPVLVLRNPRDWRASRRAQLKKVGFWDLQCTLPPACSANGPWYYDRKSLKAFWSGFDTPIVIDYDAEIRDQGSIVPSVVAALGITGALEGTDLWLNKTMEKGDP